ncbi:MAG: 4-hydroxythreonine-4-phosphate dehydrogenase PdxA [Sphaerochaetaceae bacterium]
MEKRPRICLSMGDPCGIGPEIVLKALPAVRECATLVVGDFALFEKTAKDCALDIPFDRVVYSREEALRGFEAGLDSLFYHQQLLSLEDFSYGVVSATGGRAAYESLKLATALTLENLCDALVTTPLNKESLKAAGINHIGHTEILGELTASVAPVTMFETLNLKVFFMTRHLSLRDACDAVTAERVYEAAKTAYQLTTKGAFDQSLPLAVAALNPHGSDGGLFGDEEQRAIIPAVERLQSEGLKVVGPIGADSVFHLAKMGKFRAVLSLYHDQGHIATKTLDFERTVSVTWNLPILRTSVDHGTAFDIAGQGKASAVSLIEAIKVATRYLQEGF